jgi:hypothetical protein
MLQESLSGRRKLLGDSALKVALTLATLADVRHRMGRNGDAERLLREALAIERKLLPVGDFDAAYTLTVYGRVLNALGRPKDAEPLLRESLGARDTVLGTKHYKTEATRRDLGYSLALQGRYVEGEQLMLQAYRDLGAGSDFWSRRERRETLGCLVEVYGRQGRPAEAAKYRSLLAAE